MTHIDWLHRSKTLFSNMEGSTYTEKDALNYKARNLGLTWSWSHQLYIICRQTDQDIIILYCWLLSGLALLKV
jgi:hypothetical protein